jgi:hypothetical protein
VLIAAIAGVAITVVSSALGRCDDGRASARGAQPAATVTPGTPASR